MTKCSVITLIIVIFLGLHDAQASDKLNNSRILEKISQRVEERTALVKEMTYQADSKTVITSSTGQLERTVTSQRSITFKQPNVFKDHYHQMEIDGHLLSKTEMENELKKSRKQGGQSPFLSIEFPKYNFNIKGEKKHETLSVWEVTFCPKTPAQDLIDGYAYIDQLTFDVVYMAFSPSKIPSVMKKMEAEMDFQRLDSFWQPKTFKLHMHLKVAFIFTLADKLIDIQETYSQYNIIGNAESINP